MRLSMLHSLVLSLSIVAINNTSVQAQRQYALVNDTIRWSRCSLYEQSTLYASLIIFKQNCTTDKSDTLIASWKASMTGDEQMLLIRSNDSAAQKIKSTHAVAAIVLNHDCSTNKTDTLIVVAKVAKDSIQKMSISLLPNDPAAQKRSRSTTSLLKNGIFGQTMHLPLVSQLFSLSSSPHQKKS